MEDKELDKFRCQDMEITYAKLMGIDYSQDDLHLERVFPDSWFFIKNYAKKMEILKEAMEKNILVSDTDGYLDICEGVSTNFIKK